MKKFKRGDVREDGMVYMYLKRGKPYWTTPEVCKNITESSNRSKQIRRTTKLGHAEIAFLSRKREAKKQGIPFTVTFEEASKELPTMCPVLNIPINWGVKTGKATDGSPSLDRFKPELGYVSGNIYWMSFKANTIKSNATVDEVIALANWMKKITDGNITN